jgi:hypothetical protein
MNKYNMANVSLIEDYLKSKFDCIGEHITVDHVVPDVEAGVKDKENYSEQVFKVALSDGNGTIVRLSELLVYITNLSAPKPESQLERIIRDLAERGLSLNGVIAADDTGIQYLSYNEKGIVDFMSEKVPNMSVSERTGGRMIRSLFELGKKSKE